MIKKFFALLIADPLKLPYYLWMKVYKFQLESRENIELGKRLTIKGLPLIDIKRGSRLYLGSDITLNSKNRDYHINLHSPVKLFAEGEGAEIRIGDKTRIHGTCIHALESVVIGKGCLIAGNCHIIDNNGHDLSFPDVEERINTKGCSKPVVIEDYVWIGANSVVLPGVTIGKGSVISANSVVVKDIPPMVVAGGNPATIIKEYSGKPYQKGDA